MSVLRRKKDKYRRSDVHVRSRGGCLKKEERKGRAGDGGREAEVRGSRMKSGKIGVGG